MTHSLQAWPRLVTIEKSLSFRELLKSNWTGQESLVFRETEAKNWEKRYGIFSIFPENHT